MASTHRHSLTFWRSALIAITSGEKGDAPSRRIAADRLIFDAIEDGYSFNQLTDNLTCPLS